MCEIDRWVEFMICIFEYMTSARMNNVKKMRACRWVHEFDLVKEG